LFTLFFSSIRPTFFLTSLLTASRKPSMKLNLAKFEPSGTKFKGLITISNQKAIQPRKTCLVLTFLSTVNSYWEKIPLFRNLCLHLNFFLSKFCEHWHHEVFVLWISALQLNLFCIDHKFGIWVSFEILLILMFSALKNPGSFQNISFSNAYSINYSFERLPLAFDSQYRLPEP